MAMMQMDWLGLRIVFETERPPPIVGAMWPEWTLTSKGKLLVPAHHEPVGSLVERHGGWHFNFTGEFFRKGGIPWQTIARELVSEWRVRSVAVLRADYAVERELLPHVDELSQVVAHRDELVKRMEWIAPARNGYCVSEHRNQDGASAYAGRAGRDAKRFRERDWVLRCYSVRERGVIRCELERKDVYAYEDNHEPPLARPSVTEILARLPFECAAALGDDVTYEPPQPFAAPSVRGRGDARQVYNQVVGCVLGHLERNGGVPVQSVNEEADLGLADAFEIIAAVLFRDTPQDTGPRVQLSEATRARLALLSQTRGASKETPR